jgi:diacylglycerol kinase family enzyme
MPVPVIPPGGGRNSRAALRVFMNAAAGLGRRDARDPVEEAFARGGVSAEVESVAPEAIGGAVEAAVRDGAALVAVAGGDGTLLAAAERLAGTSAALAPLPTGTLNHFSRRLGINDLDAAVRAIREGSVRSVPLGVVDDRVFLNTATFGFYADVVRRRERYRPVLRKWPAAAVAFALTVARLRMLDVTLVLDGERLERRTALVWVGVGWGSFPLVHESPERRRRPDLEIVVLRSRGLRGSARMVARGVLALWRGQRPISDPALEIFHARQLLIHCQHRIGVTLDGEVLRCEPPILIALQDDALRVVTPTGDAPALAPGAGTR